MRVLGLALATIFMMALGIADLAADTPKKVALVIGNSAYPTAAL